MANSTSGMSTIAGIKEIINEVRKLGVKIK